MSMTTWYPSTRMCRDKTSRTFSGDSCSLVIVGMKPPQAKNGRNRAETGNASTYRGRKPSTSGREHRNPCVFQACGRAAILPVVLGAVEGGIRGSQQLVLLLFHRSPRRGMRANRGQAERRGDDALKIQSGLVEAIGPEEEGRAADRAADRFRDLQ